MTWTPDEIKALRERLGMTLQEFAEALGYHYRQRAADLESGRRPPSQPARRLLDLLNEESK